MYVLVAALGVAAPLVVTLAMGEKAQAILDTWKAWLGQNNAVVMTVLSLSPRWGDAAACHGVDREGVSRGPESRFRQFPHGSGIATGGGAG